MIKPGYYYGITPSLWLWWSPIPDEYLDRISDYRIKVTLKREVYA